MRVSNLERRVLGPLTAAIAVLALMGGAMDPSGGLDPTPNPDTAAPFGGAAETPAEPATPAETPAAPAKDSAKGATAAKPAAKGEALPWDKKKAPVAAKKPDAAKPAAKKIVVTCATVTEDVCRELPACAWLADIPLDDGAVAKAHCTNRTPAVAATTPPTGDDAKKAAEAKAEVKPAAVPEAKAEVKPADAPKAKAAATGPPKHDQKLPAEEGQTSASDPATSGPGTSPKTVVVTTPPPAATKPAANAPASTKSSDDPDQSPAP
jgi:hypothetical protein